MHKIGKAALSLVLLLTMIISVPATAQAASNSPQAEPRGMYLKRCVGYEPNYTSMDYTHTPVGSVSGDNRHGSAPLHLTFTYESSSSTSASIGIHGSGSGEVKAVLAKLKIDLGVDFTYTRSWTKGTSSGVSYDVPIGKFQIINVYIPAAKTEGRLKYEVYMDGYPDDKFYEYVTLNTSFAPTSSSIHFEVKNA